MLDAGHPGFELRPLTRPVLYALHDPYFEWQNMRDQQAAYCIVDHRISGSGWRLIGHDSYRSDGFKWREVFTYIDVDTTKASNPAGC